MDGMRFFQHGMLLLLWALPAAGGLLLYAAMRRRRALERFAATGSGAAGADPGRRRAKGLLLLLGLAALVLGLARPAWNPTPRQVERRGREVVFVLDVSRSMLAEDLAPNRLERAKIAIRDCLERLRGDRVGLIVFAGTAVTRCPLTVDYGFFRMMLDQVGPDSVSRGGTLIGDAIRKAVDGMLAEGDHQDIILITDGEDHESFPVEAAREAGERGVRLLAIGLGDEGEGRRIPITDEHGRKRFLIHEGQEIRSRLDAATLRRMAAATPGGRYLNVATGTFDLGEIYSRLVASAEKKGLEERAVLRYEEKFQIFLGAAFLLLGAEALLGDRRRRTPA
jgi:Ca-activated chloride channel family protein